MGFNLLKRRALEKQRQKTEVIAMRLSDFIEQHGRQYMVGQRIPSGEVVRIALRSWWSESYRSRLEELRYEESRGAVILFAGCEQNQNGTYLPLKFSIVTHSADEKYVILNNKDIRVTPLEEEFGAFKQAIEWADVESTKRVSSKEELCKAVVSCISRAKIGTPGAIVRGVDSDGVAMAATIYREKDPVHGMLLNPQDSLALWFEREAVPVHGIEVELDPNDFINAIDLYPGSIWEVLPVYSFPLPLNYKGQDFSKDYRFSDHLPETGFVKSVIGLNLNDNQEYQVKAVAPVEGVPVSCSHLRTKVSQPQFLSIEPEDLAEAVAKAKEENESEGVSLQDLVASEESSPPASPAVEADPQVATEPQPPAQAAEETEEPPKRKPGRPPKNPQAQSAAPVVQEDSQPEEAAAVATSLLGDEEEIALDSIFDALLENDEPAAEGSLTQENASAVNEEVPVHEAPPQEAVAQDQYVEDMEANMEIDISNLDFQADYEAANAEEATPASEDELGLSTDELDELNDAADLIRGFSR